MSPAPVRIKSSYWDDFDVTDKDIEFLYNYLLEIETPLTPQELTLAMVQERIRVEKSVLSANEKNSGAIYYPKDRYQPGQALRFPSLNWSSGQVVSIRPGNNPDMAPFEVIEVALDSGETKNFASGIQDHILNKPVQVSMDDPQLDLAHVLKMYGTHLVKKVSTHVEANPDLIRIAGRWFPRALLVDINAGHLNLAEAVLEVEGGGPLPTPRLMEQLDLPDDVNPKLTEFSLNLALQEDGRFDEVGPSGEVLWYLKRLEPDQVQQPPAFLRAPVLNYDASTVVTLLARFEGSVTDEMDPDLVPSTNVVDELTIPLLFPHLRAGTLPLSDALIPFFPTAYESPRVQFTFVDVDSGKRFNGWVVRPNRYIYGLEEWYRSQEFIPGSLITIRRSEKPGEVLLKSSRRRPTREWIRTAMIGSDGGVVFAMLKHSLATTVNERMAIMIPDLTALDGIWEQTGKQRLTLQNAIKSMMRELAKLSPQGHVHAQELYAAVNMIRRCPPGPILSTLVEAPWAVHLGDLYFRLDESAGETS